MSKLQSEYEALQQKLALLKRESNLSVGGGGGGGHAAVQSTPVGAAPNAAAGPPGSTQRPVAAGAGSGPSSSQRPGMGAPSGAPRPLQQVQLEPQSTPRRAALAAKVAASDAPSSTRLPPRASENRLPSTAGASGRPPAAAMATPTGLAASDHSGSLHASSSQLQSDAAAVLQSIRFSGRHSGSALCAAAAEAFEDAEFVKLCEQSMGTQLQRTKEGATTQSRMLELAGMVKLLRRCLREALAKTSAIVDQGARLEHELQSSAPHGPLDVGTMQRRLEADAALARKEAAQIEATYKAERAQWFAEVDMQKYEVARLSRELEGLEEQRARSRDDAQAWSARCVQLEAELKEMKKCADQRHREAQVTHGEAARELEKASAVFERERTALQEEVRELRQGLGAAQQRSKGLESQVAALQAVHQSLQSSLESKEAAEAALAAQLSQVHGVLDDLRSQLAALQAERSALQKELRSSQDKVILLEDDARLKATRLEASEQQLAAEHARHQQEAAALDEQLRAAQDARAAAQAAALAANREADDARRSAGDASGARARAEAAQQQLQQQHDALRAEHAALKQKADALEESEESARADAAALQARVSDAEAALAAAKAEAGAQASRLAHLEGEFTALQEMMGEGEQRDVVSRLLSRIGTLQCAAAAAEATRRELHNQMVELRGNIRVFCRVRPHPNSAVRCLPGGTSLALSVDGREHAFGFDKVFGPQAGQEQIFGEVSELVQSALDGYHVCLFSYGQTGAGKTYTMQGTPDAQNAGIIPRAVELILSRVDALAAQEWEYSLAASFIEVYNNTLRDLLADGAARNPEAGRITDANAIKHDAAGGHTTVAGASRVPVTGAGHAAELVKRAAEARACAETAMNSTSSRSHCVFMLYIEGAHAASGTRLTGCLCLVDLAGSERLDRSLAEGQAKKEACSINQSLSALGDVFAALSSKSTHCPYRNSKLTYLLQPCLGGNGKTLMFVNINPEPASANESLCSLKFAAKVNGCETAAKGGARRNIASATGSGSFGGGAGGGGFGSTFAPMDSSFDTGRPSLAGKRAGAGGSLLGSVDKGPKRSRLG